jgi:hypothetical protein
VNGRKTLLDRAKKIFVVVDLQIGVQSALEQNAVAAECEHLFDFLENLVEAEDVAVFCADGTIESAEGAILGAEIRVVDVAIDLVGGDARVVLLEADLMGGHAYADQVVGLEHVERLLFRQCHVDSRPLACGQSRRSAEEIVYPILASRWRIIPVERYEPEERIEEAGYSPDTFDQEELTEKSRLAAPKGAQASQNKADKRKQEGEAWASPAPGQPPVTQTRAGQQEELSF